MVEHREPVRLGDKRDRIKVLCFQVTFYTTTVPTFNCRHKAQVLTSLEYISGNRSWVPPWLGKERFNSRCAVHGWPSI